MQHAEGPAGVTSYARVVAERVARAIAEAGLTALEVGGAELEETLEQTPEGLTVAQLATVGARLGTSPAYWMKR